MSWAGPADGVVVVGPATQAWGHADQEPNHFQRHHLSPLGLLGCLHGSQLLPKKWKVKEEFKWSEGAHGGGEDGHSDALNVSLESVAWVPTSGATPTEGGCVAWTSAQGGPLALDVQSPCLGSPCSRRLVAVAGGCLRGYGGCGDPQVGQGSATPRSVHRPCPRRAGKWWAAGSG